MCLLFVSEIMTRTSDLKKIPYLYILAHLQSNPAKRLKSAANNVEGVEYRRLHHVRILISHYSSRATSILPDP